MKLADLPVTSMPTLEEQVAQLQAQIADLQVWLDALLEEQNRRACAARDERIRLRAVDPRYREWEKQR